MATRAMDINTDPSSDRTMDPEWPLAACQAQMSPWPGVAVQGSQICMAPTAAWSWLRLGPSQHLWATGKATEFYSHFSVFKSDRRQIIKNAFTSFSIYLRYFFICICICVCVCVSTGATARGSGFFPSACWFQRLNSGVSLGGQVPFPTELPCPPLLLFLVVYDANNKFSQFLFENFLISPF